MKLFLGGGGNSKDSIELDKKFADSLDLSKSILYIPIALDSVRYPYPECLVWVSNALKPLGITDIVMWTEEDLKHKKYEDFKQFSGIYIGGGNTYKLLKELKDFGTFEIINKLAQDNVPIYGGSAGAIILAKTIIPAGYADTNEAVVTDFNALNLVQGYDLWCHYVGEEDNSIREYMSTYNLNKFIAIPEDAGLYVTKDTIEVIGPNIVSVFTDEKRVYKPGDILDVLHLIESNLNKKV